MSNTFENLLKNTMSDETNKIIKAKVISGIYGSNEKSYILVDIRRKKDYIVYVNEFEKVPEINDIIDVVIVDSDTDPHGIVSYKKVLQQQKYDTVNTLIKDNTIFTAIIKEKSKFGYEITLKESIENISNMKFIYLVKKEYKAGDTVSVKIKNVSNNTIYFHNSNNVTSYTQQFKIGQIFKCTIQAIVNMVLSVNLVNANNQNIISSDQVSCIIPLTDSVEEFGTHAHQYNIGDSIDAQIIAISPSKIILSRVSEKNNKIFQLLQHISKGQIIDAKIQTISTNVITLETTINNNVITCEMPTSEMAWSVIQREQMKNNVWIEGKVIKVQITNFDIATGRLQVSYKYNLPNPFLLFKKEINPATNQPWKINDKIIAYPTFNTSLNGRQSCYLNNKGVDFILHDWTDSEEGANKIKNGEPVEVVITSFSEGLHGYKITTSYENTPKRKFQELIGQFQPKSLYKCEVIRNLRGEYALKPICIINNNEEGEMITLPEEYSESMFVIRISDIPTTIRLKENDKIQCKLVFIDYNRQQFRFSINAYHNDRNKQIENTYKSSDFCIGKL